MSACYAISVFHHSTFVIRHSAFGIPVASKHIGLLRTAGIVTQGRNRLYQIAPQFLADKTDRLLDFGYCLLRMNISA